MAWIVPGCRCGATCYPPGCEIICPKHYRLVDRRLKALRRRCRRLAIKRRAPDQVARIEGYLWSKMVRQAFERSAGL